MLMDEKQSGALLLVVDDDDTVRASLASSMQARGFRVIERSCGESALEYLRHGELPDLILLDLVMPNMDGWEFRVAQLESPQLAEIPVVALSGDGSAKARAFHAEAFLAKPLTLPALLHTVEGVLGRASSAASLRSAVSRQLAFLGEEIEGTVRPLRLASLINEANVQAALSHLKADSGPRAGAARDCLERARAAAQVVDMLLTRAELFAHRHYGEPHLTKPRVLVVDDDEPSRDLLVEALQESFVVGAVPGALEALRLLRAHGDYDVVVCRLWMPHITGAELLRALSETHPEQARRFLFMAGASERDRAQEHELEPFDHLGVLRSPVLIDDICAVIKDCSAGAH